MRLSIVLPDLRALPRRFALGLLAIAVCGCSGFSTTQYRDPYTLYLTTPAPAHVEADLRDRYACATGTPLICECRSRIGECDCRC